MVVLLSVKISVGAVSLVRNVMNTFQRVRKQFGQKNAQLLFLFLETFLKAIKLSTLGNSHKPLLSFYNYPFSQSGPRLLLAKLSLLSFCEALRTLFLLWELQVFAHAF